MFCTHQVPYKSFDPLVEPFRLDICNDNHQFHRYNRVSISIYLMRCHPNVGKNLFHIVAYLPTNGNGRDIYKCMNQPCSCIRVSKSICLSNDFLRNHIRHMQYIRQYLCNGKQSKIIFTWKYLFNDMLR